MALAKSQRSLKAWGKQKWRTKSGKKSRQTCSNAHEPNWFVGFELYASSSSLDAFGSQSVFGDTP